jgi:hypothetical protein
MEKNQKVIAINEFTGKQTIFPNIKEAAAFFDMTEMSIRNLICSGKLSTKACSYFDFLYEGEE